MKYLTRMGKKDLETKKISKIGHRTKNNFKNRNFETTLGGESIHTYKDEYKLLGEIRPGRKFCLYDIPR